MKKKLSALIRLSVASLTAVVICVAQEPILKDLASSLAAQVKARGKGPVAITSLANHDYCPELGNFFVDRLNIFMAKGNSDFDVVTRDKVEEMFKEIDLKLGENYDASTFAKLGKQLGARSIVRGSFTVQSLGATISLAAQIIDVETGRIIGGDVAELPYTADLKAMAETHSCTNPEGLKNATPELRHPADSAAKAPSSPRKITENGLELALRDCTHRGDQMVCEFAIKNTLEDRQWLLLNETSGAGTASRAVDDQGQVYSVSHSRLANSVAGPGSYSTALLPSDVPIAGRLEFGGVPQNVASLSLLEISFSNFNYTGRAKFQLRSVPVK